MKVGRPRFQDPLFFDEAMEQADAITIWWCLFAGLSESTVSVVPLSGGSENPHALVFFGFE